MVTENGVIGIRIAGLSEGLHEYDFACKASDFKNPELAEPAFCNEIRVRIAVVRTEREMTVDIETKTVAEFSCDRCLEPLKKELTGKYRLVFAFSDTGALSEKSDENYRALDRNAVTVDLTEDVRETLLLSKPMKVVCADKSACTLYQENSHLNADHESETASPWKESLEKLKGK
ncbi:MAG: hypothetical protein C1941_07780 [Prosthecochloris sp.]|nr:hypothetical protein [Prosthecochloris sp.]